MSKVTENSKLALVCCSDEWRGWVSNNRLKVAHQPLHSSIRINWEFSSNCGRCIDYQYPCKYKILTQVLRKYYVHAELRITVRAQSLKKAEVIYFLTGSCRNS